MTALEPAWTHSQLIMPLKRDRDEPLESDPKRPRGGSTRETQPTKPGNRTPFRFVSGSTSRQQTSRLTTLDRGEEGTTHRKRSLRTTATESISRSVSSSKEDPPSLPGESEQENTSGSNDPDVTSHLDSGNGAGKSDRSYENWVR